MTAARSERANKPRIRTRSTKARSYLGIVDRTDAGWSVFHATPHGFVEAYAQWFESGRHLTRLIFIHAGRRWERTYDAYYSPLGAARLATQFAQEVAGKGDAQP